MSLRDEETENADDYQVLPRGTAVDNSSVGLHGGIYGQSRPNNIIITILLLQTT